NERTSENEFAERACRMPALLWERWRPAGNERASGNEFAERAGRMPALLWERWRLAGNERASGNESAQQPPGCRRSCGSAGVSPNATRICSGIFSVQVAQQ